VRELQSYSRQTDAAADQHVVPDATPAAEIDPEREKELLAAARGGPEPARGVFEQLSAGERDAALTLLHRTHGNAFVSQMFSATQAPTERGGASSADTEEPAHEQAAQSPPQTKIIRTVIGWLSGAKKAIAPLAPSSAEMRAANAAKPQQLPEQNPEPGIDTRISRVSFVEAIRNVEADWSRAYC